nr:Crp/Fnr family transcriptional regulator [Vibrio sp. D431a]
MTHEAKLVFSDYAKQCIVIPQGQSIFSEGKRSKSLYRLIDGSAILTKKIDFVEEQSVSVELEGTLMGLDSIASGKQEMSARALEDCLVCQISLSHLDDLANNDKSVRQASYKLLSKGLMASKSATRSHVTKLNQGRAHLIVDLVYKLYLHKAKPEETSSFTLPIKNNDIAEIIGVSKEKVSRLFRELKRRNILIKKGRHIVVKDERMLSKIAEGAIKINNTQCHSSL